MADYYSVYVIGLMDRLWFHQRVLFSESTASAAPKPVETPLLISESLCCPSLPSPLDEEETSTDEPFSPEKQISSESISLTLQDDSNKEEGNQEGPKTVNPLVSRISLHSSSSSTPNHDMKFRKLTTARRQQKPVSYRTQGELELEEVKGFIDLGFIIKKENMSARMMNIVPGLQRRSMHHNKQYNDASKAAENGSVDKVEDERRKRITRPYLSEAWPIERPDSQLLNHKIPRLHSAADMKKHLRFWAKTVAFEIHQE